MLSSCSDYPTSGKVYKESSTEHMSRNQYTFDSYAGYLVELDRDKMLEAISIMDEQKEFYSKYHSNSKTPLPSYLNKSVTDDATEAYESVVEERRQVIKNNYAESQKKLRTNLAKLEEERASLEADKSVFDDYTKTFETQISEIQKQIDFNQESTDKILNTIVERTNEIIVQEDIPRRKVKNNYFSLNSQIADYSGTSVTDCRVIKKRFSTKKYDIDRYIVIDHLKKDGKCYYINRPAKEVVSQEYDQFVSSKYLEMQQFNNQELKDQLKPIKKELNKAAQIASNKTGKRYSRVSKAYEKIKKEIEGIEAGIVEISDDLVEKLATQGPSIVNSNMFNDTSVSQQTKYFISNTTFIKPTLQEAKTAYRTAIDKAFQEKINQVSESAIKNVTEIDDDGEFSGLDGDFGPLIVLVDIKGTKVRGNNSSPVRFNYAEYIDIIDENHVLAKSSDLNLMVNMNGVRQSRTDERFFTDELLPEQVGKILKKVN